MTKYSNIVKKALVGSIMFTSICLSTQAQTAEQLEKYNAYLKSKEGFNKIQREAGMPEMITSSFEDWLANEDQKKTVALSAKIPAPRETLEEQKQRMRKWLNLGINEKNVSTGTLAGILNKKRERLWIRSSKRSKAHKLEMQKAREWVKQNDFEEHAILADGGIMGLAGIRDGVPRYNITYNAGAADTISVDELWPSGSSGLNLTGSNALIGIWDGGDVQTSHVEFSLGGQSRVIDIDGVSDLPINEHPTAVAGTMAATGIYYSGNPKGMAYQATVWAYDWDFDVSTEMNSAYANGLRVSNHSYGEIAGWGPAVYYQGTYYPCWYGDLAVSSQECHWFGAYDQPVADTDDVAYGNPYSLPVWAAGNDRDDAAPGAGSTYVSWYNDVAYFYNTSHPPADFAQGGYDTISDHGIAKNVLTVGAVNKISGGYAGVSSVGIAPFSGYGPTDDGRIKPDVVAAGVDLTSPVWNPADQNVTSYYTVSTGNNNSPSFATGTSFSSPSAAGAAGLIVDLREQLKPGVPFLSSSVKALLTHTADEAETIGPDYKTGWGLLNMQRAAELVQDDSDEGGKQFIKEIVLNDGDYIEFPVTVIGGESLKISIAWTDPAGTPPQIGLDRSDLMLVNDLDLRIINSFGTTNHPWALNPALPSSAATTGDNIRDNTEQVVVSNPTAQEIYTVRVTHKGNLVDDTGSVSEQTVSIVLSGIVPELRSQTRIEEFVASSASELVGWPSVVGQNYKVQATTNLVDTVWSDSSAEISASKTNTVWEETAPSSASTRFYRLIETN